MQLPHMPLLWPVFTVSLSVSCVDCTKNIDWSILAKNANLFLLVSETGK